MPRAAEHAPTQAPPELDELGAQPDPSSWEFVRAQVETIRPGDAMRLTIFLQQYPTFRDQILQEAQAVLGNGTVQQALGMLGAAPQGHGPAPSAQDAAANVALYVDDPAGKGEAPTDLDRKTMEKMVSEEAPAPAPAQAPAPDGASADTEEWKRVELFVQTVETAKDLAILIKAHPLVRQRLLDEATKVVSADVIAEAVRMADAPTSAEPADQPAPQAAPGETQPGEKPADPAAATEPEKQPAWVAAARAYNDAHPANCDEFYALTGPELIDNEGFLDPTKIAMWQSAMGIEADGKIGPHTLATARKMQKLAPAVTLAEEQAALPDDDLRKQAE